MDLIAFLDTYQTDKDCEDYLIADRFNNGEKCCFCGHGKIHKINKKRTYRYFKCASCKKEFTILTNTVFHATKSPLRKWFLCIHLLSTTSKGMSSTQLANQAKITQKTAWTILTKLRDLTTQSVNQISGVAIVGLV